MFNKSLNLPQPIQLLFIILLLFSSFFINTLYTIEIVLAIVIIYKLTWRKNEPPIIFFGLMMQLIQIVALVILSNFKNQKIENFTEFPYYINHAFHLSLLGLILIAFAFNLIVKKLPERTKIFELDSDIKNYNTNKIILWYFIITLIFPLLINLSGNLGSAHQIVHKFLELKWAFFLLFFFATINSKKVHYLILIILIDIILGFASFFSNYKEVILVLLVSYLIYNYKLKLLSYIYLLIIGVLLFVITSIWQFSKNDYRQFLSGETSQQVVVVSKEEALSKFFMVIKDFDYGKMQEGSELAINRVSYINYFSAAMAYVPEYKPHQGGNLTKEAVFRAFMPRIFFPTKEIVDDSKRTSEFTGVSISGGESGTSISMGYFSELYVDFGRYIMLVAIFSLGLLIGLLYRVLYIFSYNSLWFYAYLLPFVFCVNSFEVSLSKIIPSMIFYFIIVLFFNKFFVKSIDKYFLNN